MRRWIGGIGAFVVLGAVAWAWPLIGAAELASAVRTGDTDRIFARIDVDALRRSLARQIARAYLDVSGKGGKLGAFGRSVAGAAVTTVADPYVAQLLTPENLSALLSEGRINQVKLGDRTVAVKSDLPKVSNLLNGNIVASITGSYFDQLRDFVIPIDGGGSADDQYGIHMRLDGLTWKLGGIDLPNTMVDDMARSLLAGEKQARL